MNTEFRMSRISDKVYINVPSSIELDEYALEELIIDLQHHLGNIKAYNEAKEQNASKLRLEKELKEMFVDVFNTDGIEYNKAKVITPNIKAKLK